MKCVSYFKSLLTDDRENIKRHVYKELWEYYKRKMTQGYLAGHQQNIMLPFSSPTNCR